MIPFIQNAKIDQLKYSDTNQKVSARVGLGERERELTGKRQGIANGECKCSV